MKPKKLLTFLALALSTFGGLSAQTEIPADHDARMDWFREARFGLFIHWGVYSVPAGEWDGKTGYGEWFLEETKMPVSQYEKFATQFNPVKFDATHWVRMAKEAGMKYIVITSKHHDGFGMFRSDLTDWCIKSTPFQRDPLKELAAACKKEGVRLCFYHSIMDWHHPDWGTRRAWNDKASGKPDMDRYTAYMKGQLKELLTRYGPIGILWFDGEWEAPWTHERGVDLYNYVRGLQPKIIINNRVGKARSGMQGMDKGTEKVGDYGTPEQEIPATGFGPGVDWESCLTMNNHWGYNKHDQNWKATATLVHNLIDCSSKGGNYLLNVGPTSEGLFPEASVERLAEIGRWMKINSESIYDTTASPFKKLPWGRCTEKKGPSSTTLYLHVFSWPANGKLLVPGLKTQPQKAYLLANKKALPFSETENGIELSVPGAAPDPVSSTVVLKIKGTSLAIEQISLAQNSDGSLTLPAVEARTHGALRYESADHRDNLGFWTNPADFAEWDVKVSKPGKFIVTADIATTGNSKILLQAAGQNLEAAVPNTGDYGKFEQVRMGNLELTSPGQITVALRAVPSGWSPVNVKTIRLQPAQ